MKHVLHAATAFALTRAPAVALGQANVPIGYWTTADNGRAAPDRSRGDVFYRRQ
jgi:hypothetical protein